MSVIPHEMIIMYLIFCNVFYFHFSYLIIHCLQSVSHCMFCNIYICDVLWGTHIKQWYVLSRRPIRIDVTKQTRQNCILTIIRDKLIDERFHSDQPCNGPYFPQSRYSHQPGNGYEHVRTDPLQAGNIQCFQSQTLTCSPIFYSVYFVMCPCTCQLTMLYFQLIFGMRI